jgi:hypothetical protein
MVVFGFAVVKVENIVVVVEFEVVEFEIRMLISESKGVVHRMIVDHNL